MSNRLEAQLTILQLKSSVVEAKDHAVELQEAEVRKAREMTEALGQELRAVHEKVRGWLVGYCRTL